MTAWLVPTVALVNDMVASGIAADIDDALDKTF